MRRLATTALAAALTLTPTVAMAHSTGSPSSTTSTTSGSQILDFARQQVGERYVYGAEGPSSWDCSGLTQAAYAAAGISIPRTSGAQAAAGTQVSSPRVGDLVIYPGHVGIYAGDGQLVDASNPSRPVMERDIWGSPTYVRF